MLYEKNGIKMEYTALPQFNICFILQYNQDFGSVYFTVLDKNILIYKILWVLCLMKSALLCGEMKKTNKHGGLSPADGHIVDIGEFI